MFITVNCNEVDKSIFYVARVSVPAGVLHVFVRAFNDEKQSIFYVKAGNHHGKDINYQI